MSYYHQLRDVARSSRRKLMYETTVGAGLPVIENLQNLIAAGDELEKFNGILSGSLSFIFGKLDEGLTLSQATNVAKDKALLSRTHVTISLVWMSRVSYLSSLVKLAWHWS